MPLRRTFDYLVPRCEHDAQLREYLDRLATSGLLTLGAVEIAAAVVQHFARGVAAWLPQTAAMAGVGVLTLAVTRLGRRPRMAAWLSALLAPAMLLLGGGGADDYTLTAVLLVVITAVASVPFLPWQAFA